MRYSIIVPYGPTQVREVYLFIVAGYQKTKDSVRWTFKMRTMHDPRWLESLAK